MKTFITLSTASILLITGSVYARSDLDSASRPAQSASSAEALPQGPIVNEIVINKEPSFSAAASESTSSEAAAIPGANPSPITTTQVIEWGGQCLWYNEDIDVQFGIPTIPGYTMVGANITFKYSDADFNDVSVWETPEVDIVGIGDSSLAVDVLKGKEGQASLATWGALNQIQNDSGSGYLSFQINIDSLHNEMYWCLKAETATLITVWQ